MSGPYVGLTGNIPRDPATGALLVSADTGGGPSGGRAVFNGDSVTAGDGDPANNVFGNSWASHAALASGGRIKLIANTAVGGQSGTTVLGRIDADLAAYAPDVYLLLFGTNDVEPLPTLANYLSAINKVKATGAKLCIATIPPTGMAALATPAAPTLATATTGGTLVPGTYSYRLAALNDVGGAGAGTTLASTAATIVVPAGTSTNTVTITWPAVLGATRYKLYGRVGGSELLLATLAPSGAKRADTAFIDTGSVTPSGALPGANTTASTYNPVFAAKQAKINTIAHRLNAFYGVPLVDFYSLLVDAGGVGVYRTGATKDGTHPTEREQRRMGEAAAAAFKDYLPPAAVNLPADNFEPTNLLTNGLLYGGSTDVPGSGSSGFKAWSSYGSAVAYRDEVMTTDAAALGKVLRIARIDHPQQNTESPVIGQVVAGTANPANGSATLTNVTTGSGAFQAGQVLDNATCAAIGVPNGTTITVAPTMATPTTMTISTPATIAGSNVAIAATQTLWAPGDLLQLVMKVRATGVDTGGGQYSISLKPQGGSASPSLVAQLALSTDTPLSDWCSLALEGRVRAGTTGLTVLITTNSGPFTLDVAQIAVRNLTALGLETV